MNKYFVIKKQHGGWVKHINPMRFIGEAINMCNDGALPWVILDHDNEVVKQDSGLTDEDLEQAKKAGWGDR